MSLQGEKARPSARLHRPKVPGLLQAPTFQTVPMRLEQAHAQHVLQPPSFEWLDKLLQEEDLYPLEANRTTQHETSTHPGNSPAAAAQADELEQLRQQLHAAEARAATAATMSAQLACLRQQLQAAESRATYAVTDAQEVPRLRHQLKMAETRAAAAAVTAGEATHLRQQLQAAEAQVAAVAAEAETAAHVRAQQEAEARAADQIAQLRLQQQAVNAGAAERMANLQQQLQAAEARAAAAATQAEEVTGRCRQQEAAEAMVAQQLANLRQYQQAVNATAAQQLAVLQQQLQVAESRAAVAAARAGEVVTLRQQMQAAEVKAAEQLANLRQQHQAANAQAAEQMAALQIQLHAADTRFAAAIAEANELARLQQQQQAAEAWADAQLSGLQQQLQANTATAAAAADAQADEISSLRRQLQAAEAHTTAADAESRRVQLKGVDLIQRLTLRAREVANLQAEVDAARSALLALDSTNTSPASSPRGSRLAAAARADPDSTKALPLQQLVKQMTAKVLTKCRAAEQRAAALQADCARTLQDARNVLVAPSTSSANSTTFLIPAGSQGVLQDQAVLSLQQLADVLVVQCHSARHEAVSRQAQVQDVRSTLSAVCEDAQRNCLSAGQAGSAQHPPAGQKESKRCVQQLAAQLVQQCQSAREQARASMACLQSAHSTLAAALASSHPSSKPAQAESEEGLSAGALSMRLQQLAAALAQECKSAKAQAAPYMQAQLQEARSMLAAACADSMGACASAVDAGAGAGERVQADQQDTPLQHLASVLVQRCRSADQCSAASHAQIQEACAVLAAAQHRPPGAASTQSAARDQHPSTQAVQVLAAALVERCSVAELGVEPWRQHVQDELAELQSVWSSARIPAGTQKSPGYQQLRMLQTVRAQLVETQLLKVLAEQQAAASIKELERCKHALQAEKDAAVTGLTGLTSKQHRELQTVKQELAAAQKQAARSDSELLAVRRQLANVRTAQEAASRIPTRPTQHKQTWEPEHALAAMAGVVGVMAFAKLCAAQHRLDAASPAQDSSSAGDIMPLRHAGRIPATENPAAMLRLLRITVHSIQEAHALPGQFSCKQKEETAAGAVALREAALGAAEYALWRSVTLAADAGARARQQFSDDGAGSDGRVSPAGLRQCIGDLQRCQHELVVAAGDLMLQDLLLALSKQHLQQYQTGWLQLPMPSCDVVQKLLTEAGPVSDGCIAAASELQPTLNSLTADADRA